MRFFIAPFLLLSYQVVIAQYSPDDALYQALRQQDSLLFEVAFNTCDTALFNQLISDNFEFYHDQAGLTDSKGAFIDQVSQGLCALAYKPERRLVEGTMEVFPLMSNGHLYGAIQTGQHTFFAVEADGSRYPTSTATFTHVWILEEGVWRLRRVLSFNHQKPRQMKDGESD